MTEYGTQPPAPQQTAENRLPGDLTREQLIERLIRVDHAGEFGARRIYEGQLAILRPHLTERVLTTMALQAWHRHGTTDPIQAARQVVAELTSVTTGAVKRRP